MKKSDTYRRQARDLDAFAAALHGLIEVLEPQASGFMPGSPRRWFPRDGLEHEANRRRAEVDMLAGPAAYAFNAAGVFVEWKPRGTFQTRPVNPAQGWGTILEWDPAFDVSVIISCATQALGILQMKAEEAEELERPSVRRAAGRLGRLTGSGLRPLARWTVRSVGVLTLTVAGAGLTQLLGWA